MQHARVAIVVALGKGRVIGKGNQLLWRIPDDLKRFKKLTLGHPVIMGRKTFESIVKILGTPLPERTNIVVTRDNAWSYAGVHVTHSLEEAIALARTFDQEEIHIGGGAELYQQALPYVDRLYLTLINDTKEGDAVFPPYETEFTKILEKEKRDHNGLAYEWLTLERSDV